MTHNYFVSYLFDKKESSGKVTGENAGSGHSVVPMDREIKTMQDLDAIAAAIMKKCEFTRITILNFIKL